VKRGRELFDTFERICKYAKDTSADAVIIAGDLFDTGKATAREISNILSEIEECRHIRFLYVCGNHEGDIILKSTQELPSNLTVFGNTWEYVNIGDVTFAGKSRVGDGLFSDLTLDVSRKNIVILHGDARPGKNADSIINLTDAAEKGIDYLALGHYHTYRVIPIDRRGIAVYCGTPEGRGFDEIGEMGFVEIDTDKDINHKFIPFSKRTVRNIEADLTGVNTELQVREAINRALDSARAEDMVRITLVGERQLELRYDKDRICKAKRDDYFHLEIKDESRLYINPEDYKFDKTLKGEFIRLCLSEEDLDNEERELMIRSGLSALAGEAFDGIE
jgi:DNA repair exonuclease SbcCD nuclease subunit